jgi:hypothetical protein
MLAGGHKPLIWRLHVRTLRPPRWRGRTLERHRLRLWSATTTGVVCLLQWRRQVPDSGTRLSGFKAAQALDDNNAWATRFALTTLGDGLVASRLDR